MNDNQSMSAEPWLRGGITEVDSLRAAVLYSFQHAREDVTHWTEGIPEKDLCRNFQDVAPISFQIRHIAGSVDRLMTYAQGRQLTEEQLQTLRTEKEGTFSRAELLDLLNASLTRAESAVRSLNPAEYNDLREIGRQRVPVPLGVLLVHIAEHTQRHVGELIVTARIANQENR